MHQPTRPLSFIQHQPARSRPLFQSLIQPAMSPIFNRKNVAVLALFTASCAAATCNSTALNTTIGIYNITTYPTTVFTIASETNRGVCDIARYNLMSDAAIIPNIGQQIYIPAEVCDPDNDTCLIANTTSTNTCINGGPRLYYSVNGDSAEIIARRLNITTDSIMTGSAAFDGANETTVIDAGQWIKVPLCDPSSCTIQPASFSSGVYKDLAEEYDTTVGQIMMLSPTYNYSHAYALGEAGPTIDIPMNCTALSANITALT